MNIKELIEGFIIAKRLATQEYSKDVVDGALEEFLHEANYFHIAKPVRDEIFNKTKNKIPQTQIEGCKYLLDNLSFPNMVFNWGEYVIWALEIIEAERVVFIPFFKGGGFDRIMPMGLIGVDRTSFGVLDCFALKEDKARKFFDISLQVMVSSLMAVNDPEFQTGQSKERIREKVKIDKKNKFFKVNKVVHIKPRKMSNNDYQRQVNSTVDWSHAFDVRGHWRKIKGVGKNRSGDYCIEGRTWVKPHRKKEELEYVKKQRVVMV